jgi:hypothetical protein
MVKQAMPKVNKKVHEDVLGLWLFLGFVIEA